MFTVVNNNNNNNNNHYYNYKTVYMIKENLFNCHQHGFIQGKSCFTNLIELFQDWINAINQGHGVDIVYLDYKKAFDSVPHQRLLHKLSKYGICNKVLWWITNFLSNRLQRVVINGSASTWSKVLSDVPQGSVLGLSGVATVGPSGALAPPSVNQFIT